MEILGDYLLPLALGGILARFLTVPVKAAACLLRRCLKGIIYLTLVNGCALFTGITLSINLVTILASGMLGLPGVAGLILLEIM